MKIEEVHAIDAETVKYVMQRAFAEYNNDPVPSGAMQETTESIQASIAGGEETAAVCSIENRPVGIVRVREEDGALYFFRLSVLPEERGNGIAAALIRWVESKALQLEKEIVFCKVRASTPHNVRRYERLGYHIYDTFTVDRPEWPSFDVVSMKKKIPVEQSSHD
ncbi:GNAT family N-acetyltransferase [Salibacterium halotolerans]|uniref:Ribosomal protein S18 acetylase RimI n=1 Tax=Salibacterium halotolerans TaxID=1884432 RepID=A0A1I5TSY2_9BACI|nr:GNAT family N-acetyltransferase [Salibacterium halotolerans]SFP86159.1 Ribosomal protein S18 acetylase RimI [Salibacterium halotolerans]